MIRPLVAERSEGFVMALATASAGSAAVTAAAAAANSSAVFPVFAPAAASASGFSSPIARANAVCAAATAAGRCSDTTDSSRRKHSGATTYTSGSGTRRFTPHCSSVARSSSGVARGGSRPSALAASHAATCALPCSPSGKYASSRPRTSVHFFRTRRSSVSTVSPGRALIFNVSESVVRDLIATWNLSSPPAALNPSASPILCLCAYGGGANIGGGLGKHLTCDEGKNVGEPPTTDALYTDSTRPGRPTKPLSFFPPSLSARRPSAPVSSSSPSREMLRNASRSSTAAIFLPGLVDASAAFQGCGSDRAPWRGEPEAGSGKYVRSTMFGSLGLTRTGGGPRRRDAAASADVHATSSNHAPPAR